MRFLLPTIVFLILSSPAFSDDSIDVLAARTECGGEELNLPSTSFDIKGRSKSKTDGFYECFRHIAPKDTQGMIAGQEVLWDRVFTGVMTRAEARNTWQQIVAEIAENNKGFVERYMESRLSSHFGGGTSTYDTMRNDMNQQQIIQNQQQMMFNQQMQQQQQFMRNGGYGG